MIIYIFLLSILSLFQSSVISIDLVLIFILSRSFIVEEKQNFYLAFGFGLFLAFLNNQTLGILSLMYLVFIKIAYILRHLPIASKAVFLVPIIGVLLIIEELILGLIFKFTIDWKVIIWELVFIYPIYLLVRFWEDRFIPQKNIRLKIRK